MCGALQTKLPTTRHYVVNEDGHLANVFVYIKKGLENRRFAAPTNAALLDQVKCFFEPYMLGAQTGQTVQFRNSDAVLHNIHVTSRVNREFNIAQPLKGTVTTKTFDKPEVFLRVKCDVHPWMFAYIGVVAHPYFAVTDKDGSFRFPFQLPPGTYTIAANHLKAGELTQEITVREGELKTVNFLLGLPAR